MGLYDFMTSKKWENLVNVNFKVNKKLNACNTTGGTFERAVERGLLSHDGLMRLEFRVFRFAIALINSQIHFPAIRSFLAAREWLVREFLHLAVIINDRRAN